MYNVTEREDDRQDAESHGLLLFDVFRSDGMRQRDDRLLLRVSGQSFPHVCNKRRRSQVTAPPAAPCAVTYSFIL